MRRLAVEDLPAVAAIHMAAFPQSAITRLGVEAARRYYEWQLLGPHDVVALGAYSGGTLVGFGFGGTFRGATSGFLRKNYLFLAWRVLTSPKLLADSLVRQRLGSSVDILRKLAKRKAPVLGPTASEGGSHSFGILSLAVHPQDQGRGAGKLLMEELESCAVEHGFQELHLTVHTDNHHAIRFYESRGWQRQLRGHVWTGKMTKMLIV